MIALWDDSINSDRCKVDESGESQERWGVGRTLCPGQRATQYIVCKSSWPTNETKTHVRTELSILDRRSKKRSISMWKEAILTTHIYTIILTVIVRADKWISLSSSSLRPTGFQSLEFVSFTDRISLRPTGFYAFKIHLEERFVY